MKRIVFNLLLLVYATSILSQSHYYTVTKTIEVNEYTYQCDVPSYGMVYLYNKSNTLRDVPMLYKETNEIYGTPENEDIPVIVRSSYKNNLVKCKGIIQNVFDKHKEKLQSDQNLCIVLYLNSQTGRVREVEFSFHRDESFGLIPIEDFIWIEQELKEKIQITPTSEGKKLNYIFFWWDQHP